MQLGSLGRVGGHAGDGSLLHNGCLRHFGALHGFGRRGFYDALFCSGCMGYLGSL